jgi:hypothetical protein
MDHITARYDPMNRSHILGFLNHLPHIDWQTYFPQLRDQEGDYVSLHLIKFHIHICRLGVEFHEDYLMKIVMVTLEENA